MRMDKETIDAIRTFETEYRLQEIKESLDRTFGKDSYSSHNSNEWTDKEIAKLDYIFCEIESIINKL